MRDLPDATGAIDAEEGGRDAAPKAFEGEGLEILLVLRSAGRVLLRCTTPRSFPRVKGRADRGVCQTVADLVANREESGVGRDEIKIVDAFRIDGRLAYCVLVKADLILPAEKWSGCALAEVKEGRVAGEPVDAVVASVLEQMDLAEQGPASQPASTAGQSFDAFLSYTEAQRKEAKLFWAKLSRVGAAPWSLWTWNRLRVYIDQDRVRAGDEIPASIDAALLSSSHLVLLASRAAAHSVWVNREILRWARANPGRQPIPVRVDGRHEWDDAESDFDWARTDCLPRAFENLRVPCNVAEFDGGHISAGAKILRKDAEWLGGREASRHRWFRIVIVALAGSSLFFAGRLVGMIREAPVLKHLDAANAHLDGRRNASDVRSAIDELERGLEIDSTHEPSLVLLAKCYILLVGLGGASDAKADLDRASELLKTAERLSPESDRDRLVLQGRLLLYGQRDVLGARKIFEEAWALDPRSSEVLHNLSATYAFVREYPKAIEISKEAVRKAVGADEVLRAHVNLGWTYYHAKDFEKARRELAGFVLKEDQSNDQANRLMGHMDLLEGDGKGALNHYLKAGADSDPTQPQTNRNLFAIYSSALGLTGEMKQARANLANLRDGSAYLSPYRLAQAYTQLGDDDQALAMLERARREYDPFLTFVRSDPLLERLDSNPKFGAFLNTVGFGD